MVDFLMLLLFLAILSLRAGSLLALFLWYSLHWEAKDPFDKFPVVWYISFDIWWY